jgi:GGDEF domain-containing protein
MSMDESWVLIDSNTGLHVSWYFWLRVLDEVNRAARYGAPFALLMLEAEAAPGKLSRLTDEALSYVPACIRSTDLGGALGRGAAAVLLTHQDAEAAETARARILDRLAAVLPSGIRWRTELLCYPEHSAEISNLLTGGHERRSQGSDIGRSA